MEVLRINGDDFLKSQKKSAFLLGVWDTVLIFPRRFEKKRGKTKLPKGGQQLFLEKR